MAAAFSQIPASISLVVLIMQGRIQTEVEGGGGNLERECQNTMESERAEGAQKFLGRYSRKFSCFSTQ